MRDLPAGVLPPGSVALGTIVSTVAHLNCAIVAIPGRRPRPALYVTAFGNYGLGVRETKTLANNTLVVVLLLPDSPWDYVLGPASYLVSNPGRTPSDFAQQGSGTNFFSETVHSMPALSMIGLKNASGGTLGDLFSGEWAITNEFGAGVCVERFGVWMRVDEMCGFWTNMSDHSTRIAGQTIKVDTFGSEERNSFDDGELNRVYERALSPAESVGLKELEEFAKQFPTFSEDTGSNPFTEGSDPLVATEEPINGEAVMAPRYMEFDGRFGDMVQRFITLPNQGKTEYVQSDAARLTALLRERLGTDGSYLLESKSRICLHKSVDIPAPVRVKQADDRTKEISDSKHADDFDWSLDEYRSAGVVVQALEHHSYLANIESYRSFRGRDDWALNQAEISENLPANAPPERLWANAPATEDVDLHIDREPKKFFHSTAGFDILDDGSVKIWDAWGSEIVMSGGNIFVSCSGDIYELPGRNKITWAPGDIVQRSGENLELSTSRGDVRIKSERNVSVLSGNSGEGGTLIENRGTNDEFTTEPGQSTVLSGVSIKSSTPVYVDGSGVRVVASGGGSDPGIHLDDRSGLFDIRTTGQVLLESDTAVLMRIGDATHTFDSTSVVFNALQVFMAGDAIVRNFVSVGDGVLVFDGDIAAYGGSIFTDGDIAANGTVAAFGGVTGPLLGELEEEPVPALGSDAEGVASDDKSESQLTADEFITRFDDQLSNLADAVNAFDLLLTEQSGLFESVRPLLSFSFRLDEDYTLGHNEFWLPEPMWQRRMRQGSAGVKWDEPTVTSPDGTQTMPHPGLQTWSTNGKQLSVDSDVFNDTLTGAAKTDSVDADPEAEIKEISLTDYITNTQE